MPSRYDVFVSYAEADRSWVEGFLLAAFDEADVRYHHERNFTLGAPLLDEMQRAVRESEYTLIVLSPAYFADGSGEFIDLLAQTYGLETATWPVIPLKLREVTPPPRLAMLKGLDWTDPRERARQVEQLCQVLGDPVQPTTAAAARLPLCRHGAPLRGGPRPLLRARPGAPGAAAAASPASLPGRHRTLGDRQVVAGASRVDPVAARSRPVRLRPLGDPDDAARPGALDRAGRRAGRRARPTGERHPGAALTSTARTPSCCWSSISSRSCSRSPRRARSGSRSCSSASPSCQPAGWW